MYTVKRDLEVKSVVSIITIIELDLPELTVTLPEEILIGKVNLNDDFLV